MADEPLFISGSIRPAGPVPQRPWGRTPHGERTLPGAPLIGRTSVCPEHRAVAVPSRKVLDQHYPVPGWTYQNMRHWTWGDSSEH